ncbi:MAG: hypothetical protein ACTSSP_00160 [Candidatus Asgardarchaeia archaeon]
MKKQRVEIRPGDWFRIYCENGEYGTVHFDEPQKIAKVKGKFFQIVNYDRQYDKGEKYTISNYKFTRVSKKKCDEKIELIAKIDEAEKLIARLITEIVKKIENIDDDIDVSYHDGKYASQKYI